MSDRTNPDSPEGADLTQETGDSGVASARQRFQRLGEDFQDRYKKVSDDVRRGAERATDEIRRGADRAKETYGDVSRNAQRSYDRVRSEAGNVSREVSLFVRDNPGKSVLIAAGVGFLLGLVARRRGDDDDDE
jgi:ElaB/YqjD/DUF883 family membrane-anchored ribosome-binding protein